MISSTEVLANFTKGHYFKRLTIYIFKSVNWLFIMNHLICAVFVTWKNTRESIDHCSLWVWVRTSGLHQSCGSMLWEGVSLIDKSFYFIIIILLSFSLGFHTASNFWVLPASSYLYFSICSIPINFLSQASNWGGRSDFQCFKIHLSATTIP